MNKYLLTFEAYSERKKKRIWDQLLKRKKRPLNSVNVEPETQERSPDMTIPSADVNG